MDAVASQHSDEVIRKPDDLVLRIPPGDDVLRTPSSGAFGNDGLDSLSSSRSLYSGVGDMELNSIALDSRRIYAEEFAKLRKMPQDELTLSVVQDAVERLRALILQCEHECTITECVLAILDPKWMLPCLHEYPAYGVPLQQDVDKFAPYILRKKLRGVPRFVSSFVQRELVPNELVPFFVESDGDHENLAELIEDSRARLNNLMSVAFESDYEMGLPFRGVVGMDRSASRRVAESKHHVVLPTAVFARALLIHTDACGGETSKMCPFPCFDLYAQPNSETLTSTKTRRSPPSSRKARRYSRLCSTVSSIEEKSLRVQLIDTHSLSQGVVLVGPSVMAELNLSEGLVVILRQVPPKMPRCTFRRKT